MSFTDSNSFRDLYHIKKQIHSSIFSIDAKEVSGIHHQIIRDVSKQKVNDFKVLSLFLLILIANLLFVGSPLAVFCKLSTKALFELKPATIIYSKLRIGHFMMFLTLMPLFLLTMASVRLDEDEDDAVGKRELRRYGSKFLLKYRSLYKITEFYKVAIPLIYSTLIFGLLALSITFRSLSQLVGYIYPLLLLAPVLFLVFYINARLLAISLRLLRKRRMRPKFSYDSCIEIIMCLLNLLHWLDSSQRLLSADKAINYSYNSIFYRVSRSITLYGAGLYTGKYSKEAFNQLHRASAQFDKSVMEILMLNDIDELKRFLINYLNVFLTFRIADLPKLPQDEDVPKREKRLKFRHYIMLFASIIFPIVSFILISFLFKLRIDDMTTSALKVLYVIYIVFCLVISPVLRIFETNELLKDLIKSVFGKG